MITFAEAYGWLNQGDRSHLSAANHLSIIQLSDPRIDKGFRENIATSLRVASETVNDTLESLEIKVALAKYNFDKSEFSAARVDMSGPVEKYPVRSHRMAVARWLYGMILWNLRENQDAHSTWKTAESIFTDLSQEKVRRHEPDMVVWYTKQISAMALDLICKAEEAIFWMNALDRSNLSPVAKSIMTEITQRVRVKDYPLAHEIGLRLSRISKTRFDTSESAEVWAAIGLASIQMGNPRQAIEYLKRGEIAFAPRSHRQALTRWMLGVACWQIPGEGDQAVIYWREAIDTFQDLKRQMDISNQQDNKNWYATRITTMEKALERTTKEKLYS